jgi:PleD family two-component response regulator
MELPLTCLLIDNDEEDQEIFGMALKEADASIQCVFANGCHSALQKLKEDPSFIPSLIFIDMNMPLMNGTQCLQEIKRLDHLKESRIFIYSTDTDPAAIAEIKELGAHDFIVKPPSFSGLVEVLSQLLQTQINHLPHGL